MVRADGATITLERGIIKASRGMGDDIMRSSSSIPRWSKIYDSNIETYSRKSVLILEIIKFLNVHLSAQSKALAKKKLS